MEIRDDCCICLENNMALFAGNGNLNGVRLSCCGSLFCKKFKQSMLESNAKTGRKFTCPMCRTPLANSANEDFDRCVKHAKEGRAWALLMVALCYENGQGVGKSLEKAFEYYLLAADKGDTVAQSNLGSMYENGEGGEQSYEKAFHYYTQGFPGAQYNVGVFYRDGKGVEKSLTKVFEWYTQAAENGHAAAQSWLGYMYDEGEGIEKNKEKAFYYYTQAAEQEHKKAQYNLAHMYTNGEGVVMNRVKAIYWFRQCMKDNKNEEDCKRAKEYTDSLREFAQKRCGSCGKEGIKLTQCAKCYSIFYCSRECQGKDWKEGKHKEDCKKV